MTTSRDLKLVNKELLDASDGSGIERPFGSAVVGTMSAHNGCTSACAAFQTRNEKGVLNPPHATEVVCLAGSFIVNGRLVKA